MENLYRLAHIGIIILVSVVVFSVFSPTRITMAQTSAPATISELAAAHVYDSERIKSLENQMILLRAQVDEVRQEAASVKSAGATVMAVVGALSLLGLLAKRRTAG